ncbi:MAG: YfhO family protein [Anaerobutyricum soehngenii]
MGLERLIEKKDGRLYCIALFYALYCNYYIAFMICIFAVIWYLLYSFKSIKQFFLPRDSFCILFFSGGRHGSYFTHTCLYGNQTDCIRRDNAASGT